MTTAARQHLQLVYDAEVASRERVREAARGRPAAALWAQLLELGPHGVWEGPRGELARRLGVQERTVTRWVAELEASGVLLVEHFAGRPSRYVVLRRLPSAGGPETLDTELITRDMTLDTTLDMTRDIVSRVGGASLSSSSSPTLDTPSPTGSGTPDTTRDTATLDTPGTRDMTLDTRDAPHKRDGGDGGAGDGSGGGEETEAAWLLARRITPDGELARLLSGLSREGRELALRRLRDWEQRHGRELPPSYFGRVLGTEALYETAALRGKAPSAPAEPRPAAQPSTSSAPSARPRPRAGGWRSIARGALAVAVGVADRALCGGALTGGGR